jgi:PAS domain S-box-containing protein
MSKNTSHTEFLSNTLSPTAILTGTFLLFLGPFLIVELLPVQMEAIINKSTYLFFHNSTEFFSMMVSFSLFGVGWYSYDQSRDRRALFLGVSFLAVGLVDFMHTMSNAAMPAFITSNSTNKSTQFWITARLLDSSALLVSAFVYPDTQSRWLSKTCLMTAAVAISVLTFVGVIFFESGLPATAIQGIGLTPLKRYAEFLVIFFLMTAGVLYWKRMKRTGDRRLLYFLAALIISIFSEAIFASYKTGFDTYNVLGHIYKVVAFYLIYKGVFATAVEKPYVGLSDSNEKLRVEIAERKHAEEEIRKLNEELEQRVIERTTELQESEDRYRSLFDNMTEGFAVHEIVTDVGGRPMDYRFLAINSSFERLTGLKRQDLIGRLMTECLPNEDPEWISLYGKVALTGEPLQLEKYSPTLGRWYEVIAFRPAPQQFAAIFMDVTERKQAERALRDSEDALRQTNENLEQRVRERTMDLQNLTEQLERSRDELRKLASELVMAEERERKRIAGVLHDDIAQILAAARMRLALLQGIQSDPNNTQTLEEIKSLLSQSIQETRALMNDLGNPLLFDMGLQAACAALANSLMERHPIQISCNIRDSYKHLNPDVKTILYQLIRELLNNVVKHSQAENAHVMIDMENGHVRVEVTDNGMGFDPQMLGAPTVEGGFGLYSIRERLIAIDGSLRIESAPGSGTIVTAILPAALD